MKRLTILICTHNRAELLDKAIQSLNKAQRPKTWAVDILVAANACEDGTHTLLENYQRQQNHQGRLKLEWFAEPAPGKSNALNTAIPLVKTCDIVAFVDDDHRVDTHYLENICRAADAYPQITMFCGRILPDWDGSEPAWVHDEGPYKIRPLPIPRSDSGPSQKELSSNDPTPGGGNLFLRSTVFDRTGFFQTKLGPHGHDLGGGEDSAFVQAALACGERLMYIPGVLQYHYVDKERLSLRYLLRKAYHRSRSTILARNIRTSTPPYLWRKLAQNITSTILSFDGIRFRFHLVRIATTLGEISGFAATKWIRSSRQTEIRRNAAFLACLLGLVITGIASAFIGNANQAALVMSAMALSAAFTTALGIKSIADFTHTGPHLKDEILTHYKRYSVFAFSRLLGYAFAVLCILSFPGIVSYFAYSTLTDVSPRFGISMLAGTVSILSLVGLQFSRHLLWLPANITASYNYRVSRLYPYWQRLSTTNLRFAAYILLGLPAAFVAYVAAFLYLSNSPASATAYTCVLLFYIVLGLWLRTSEPIPVKGSTPKTAFPNIVMIGSDTLRSDRIDGTYAKDVAPNIKKMSEKGILFSQCYVPCARTAPSLLALLSGTWPHRFGVRDNFVPDEATRLSIETLPRILKNHGYRTAALSDWCGADMGKFDLSFDYIDVPEDQWNIKLFIRQGPKDIRLFLSLFARNHIGKLLLPEIHYLGGVPQTDELGLETRHLINHLATDNQPFFLNVFFSTTHGPFGSEYPYYTRFTKTDYKGESKFVMARVTDPWEIIRRQAEPREEFDLDQIIGLYDGCVSRFDDEVQRIVSHLEQGGLADNTIVVVYSDHGMEFFEHQTWGQGNSVISDVSNKIPLLIRAPGLQQGRTIPQPVRSIDLAPTLLDLAGIEPITEMDGASLKPFMQDSNINPDFDVYSETGIWLTHLPGTPPQHLSYPNLLDLLTVRNIETGTISIKPEFEETIVCAKDRVLRKGHWKLVYQPLQDGYLLKLFDVALDPSCQNDVSSRNPDLTNNMWKRLEAWILSDPLMNSASSTVNRQSTALRRDTLGISNSET